MFYIHRYWWRIAIVCWWTWWNYSFFNLDFAYKDAICEQCVWLFVWVEPEAISSGYILAEIGPLRGKKNVGPFIGSSNSGCNSPGGTAYYNNIQLSLMTDMPLL